MRAFVEGKSQRLRVSASIWVLLANAGYGAATIYIGLSLILCVLFGFAVVFGAPIFGIYWLADHLIVSPH